MKVLFIGSTPGYNPDERQEFPEKYRQFIKIGKELGYTAAHEKHVVLIGSDSANTLDLYVAQGVIQYCEEHSEAEVTIELHRPETQRSIYTDIPPNLKVVRYYYPMEDRPLKWIVAHFGSLAACDWMVNLGGDTGTRIIGNIAMELNKAFVPIPLFGGASGEFHKRFQPSYKHSQIGLEAFECLNRSWDKQSATEILELGQALLATKGVYKHAYFISYSRSDMDIADHIEVLLRRNNRNVLRDEEEIKPGESLAERIEDLINQSDTVVALWSKNSSKSNWCRNELMYADKRRIKDTKTPRIVLVTLDDTEILIPFLDILCQSGKNREQRERSVEKLIEGESKHTN